jgi:5-methylcytosine-specific restriction endonuclease McrA
MDKKKYPKDWPQISRRIRFERAEGKCEWCGIPNYALRDKDSSMYVTSADLELLDDVPFDLAKATMIILTVAHLGTPLPDGTPVSKQDTMDVRDENLAALCQKCHLDFDRADHLRNRIINRRRRLVEAGQQEMF